MKLFSFILILFMAISALAGKDGDLYCPEISADKGHLEFKPQCTIKDTPQMQLNDKVDVEKSRGDYVVQVLGGINPRTNDATGEAE